MSRFSLLTVSLFGLIVAPAQAEKPRPKVELKLSLSKNEIVQLEPIALTISLKNLSKEPQKVYPIFDPDADYLKIFLTTSDGKTSCISDSGLISDRATGPYTLSPKGRNDVIRYRLILTGGPHGWMDTPGEYKLHVTFVCLKGEKPLISKPIKLTVKAAEGVDKEALDRFRGYPQAEFLARLSTAGAIAEQFRFVIRKYPKSVYTPWCYYILGWAVQNKRSAFASDASQAQAARDYYGRLLKAYPKFPLKTEVEYEMARELLREGKEEEAAIDQIETLANKHPDLWLFRRVNFTLKSFRQRGRIAPAKELPPHCGL